MTKFVVVSEFYEVWRERMKGPAGVGEIEDLRFESAKNAY